MEDICSYQLAISANREAWQAFRNPESTFCGRVFITIGSIFTELGIVCLASGETLLRCIQDIFDSIVNCAIHVKRTTSSIKVIKLIGSHLIHTVKKSFTPYEPLSN